MAIDKEELKRIEQALVQWFRGQDIPPGMAVCAMAELCGIMVGDMADSPEDLTKGLRAFTMPVIQVAMGAFDKKSKRGRV